MVDVFDTPEILVARAARLSRLRARTRERWDAFDFDQSRKVSPERHIRRAHRSKRNKTWYNKWYNDKYIAAHVLRARETRLGRRIEPDSDTLIAVVQRISLRPRAACSFEFHSTCSMREAALEVYNFAQESSMTSFPLRSMVGFAFSFRCSEREWPGHVQSPTPIQPPGPVQLPASILQPVLIQVPAIAMLRQRSIPRPPSPRPTTFPQPPVIPRPPRTSGMRPPPIPQQATTPPTSNYPPTTSATFYQHDATTSHPASTCHPETTYPETNYDFAATATYRPALPYCPPSTYSTISHRDATTYHPATAASPSTPFFLPQSQSRALPEQEGTSDPTQFPGHRLGTSCAPAENVPGEADDAQCVAYLEVCTIPIVYAVGCR